MRHTCGWSNRDRFKHKIAHILLLWRLQSCDKFLSITRDAAGLTNKRGADCTIRLEDNIAAVHNEDVDVLVLDNALSQLAERDSQQSRIVELRFFAGLTVEETAALLGISAATVKRDWSMAKAWLSRQIKRGESGNQAGLGKN
jgi:DNA-directed RNA polymerase specialized sigma24 family protein